MQIIKDLFATRAFQEEVNFDVQEYPPGENIVSKGAQHQVFYIIKQGKVKVILQQDVHSPETSIILGPDESFGEYALFDNLPASATVVAETRVQLIQIDIPTLRIFLEKNPAIGYKVCLYFLRKLIKRLRESNITIVNFYTSATNL